jgi:cell wall-associated NlpC family hydrolase
LRATPLAALCIAMLCFACAPAALAADSGGAGAASAAPPPAPAPAPAPTPDPGSTGGGAAAGVVPFMAHPTVPGEVGVIRHGIAYAPANAPIEVQRAIWAANRLRHKPYIYGGGHQSFRSRGYDCSGTVSYALHGGGLLTTPLDSSDFMTWGEAGTGTWITVYTNPSHAWMIIAGLRLDTSGPGHSGPRWRKQQRSTRGFTARHPVGF